MRASDATVLRVAAYFALARVAAETSLLAWLGAPTWAWTGWLLASVKIKVGGRRRG